MKRIYRVSTRVFKKMGEKYPVYRAGYEDFKNLDKAQVKFDRLIELHSPEWEISIGNISSGFYNMVISDNRIDHALWLSDEQGYENSGYNLDSVRKSRLKERIQP